MSLSSHNKGVLADLDNFIVSINSWYIKSTLTRNDRSS